MADDSRLPVRHQESRTASWLSRAASRFCEVCGIAESNLEERGPSSWFVLLVALPLAWATTAMTVFIHGYSTSWSAYYLSIVIMFSVEGFVMIPWSLRFTFSELACGWYGRVWKPVGVLIGHYITVVVLLGLITDAIPVPFGSNTLTTAALFIMAPCFLLVDHVTNPMDFASRGGTTPISIVAFHAINGMRLIDPVADLSLGIRVLNSAIRSNVTHPCPYGSNSNCPAHWGLGATITVAAILDFAAVIVILHGLRAFKHISDLTKQRVSEVVMLICEVTVFVSAVLVSHYDMLADSSTRESRDLRSYAVLCSISTFCALCTTLLLLLIPAATWSRLMHGELPGRIREIAMGVGSMARGAIRTRGRSLFGGAADVSKSCLLPGSCTVIVPLDHCGGAVGPPPEDSKGAGGGAGGEGVDDGSTTHVPQLTEVGSQGDICL